MEWKIRIDNNKVQRFVLTYDVLSTTFSVKGQFKKAQIWYDGTAAYIFLAEEFLKDKEGILIKIYEDLNIAMSKYVKYSKIMDDISFIEFPSDEQNDNNLIDIA